MEWSNIANMPTDGIQEELITLLNTEKQYTPPSPDSISPITLFSSSSSSSTPDDIAMTSSSLEEEEDEKDDVDDIMRRNVCQWAYEFVDYCLLDREVVVYCMHYYDRYISSLSAPPSDALSRILALSCLYVAVKIHGTSSSSTNAADSPSISLSKRLTLQHFCKMSRGEYCPQMIEEMELSLLTTLNWRLNPPSPTDFLTRFVKILSLLLKDDIICGQQVGKVWSVFEVARYQIELSVYSPHKFSASTIALAAILNSMDSKIVRSKTSIVSSSISRSFLQHVKSLGGGFEQLDVDGTDIIAARTTLKKLCSKTIVLPGHIIEDQESSKDIGFVPIAEQVESYEYELPQVQSVSPVSVTTDQF